MKFEKGKEYERITYHPGPIARRERMKIIDVDEYGAGVCVYVLMLEAHIFPTIPIEYESQTNRISIYRDHLFCEAEFLQGWTKCEDAIMPRDIMDTAEQFGRLVISMMPIKNTKLDERWIKWEE